jgi:hypothetical protein
VFFLLLFETAIATGALVTPIDQDISAALSDYDGVGALLRW